MKNIKLRLALVLLFVSLFTPLYAATQNVSAELENKRGILHPKGLLWKIEKQGMPPSYLYGTMHVSDPRVTKLAPPVERAFVKAEYFVMEVLMNFEAMGYMAQVSFFDNGRTLKEIMHQSEYERLTRLINERLFISESVVKHMKPWAVLMMLMVPADQQSTGAAALDMVLYRRATQRNAQVSGLETIEEQVSVFESMSLEDQLWMLNRSIDEIKTTDAQFPQMVDAYVDRDLAKLVAIQQAFMYEDSEIDDRFMHQLLNVRNVRMAKRAQPILKKGNAFIAIGALHLPGKTGVLHLLEQQGYVVTSIY
ncbi:FIG00450913: hypothetical protein [hydrothermal vent metagenome]|uniref:TraB/GumN family protein n=1 Tax=hydrothermal vent metagenome TaxID=652676 RepID=A0A3B0XUF0_9ZZZZ